MQISHIIKKYDEKTVVNDVSFSLPKGKVTSLIGPNGAGKSTVMSIISRLIAADNGSVVIDGIRNFQGKIYRRTFRRTKAESIYSYGYSTGHRICSFR